MKDASRRQEQAASQCMHYLDERTQPATQYCDIEPMLSHDRNVRSILCLPEMLITGSDDTCVRVFSMDDLHKPLHILEYHQDSIRSLSRLSDDSFVSAAVDGSVAIWRASAGKLVAAVDRYPWGTNNLTAAGSASDGTLILGDDSGSVYFRRAEPSGLGALTKMHCAHKKRIRAIKCHDNIAVCASEDASVSVWDVQDRRMLKRLIHSKRVFDVTLDSRHIITATTSEIRIYGSDYSMKSVIRGLHDTNSAIALCGAHLLASAGVDGVIAFSNLDNVPTTMARFSTNALETPSAITFAHDGRVIVTCKWSDKPFAMRVDRNTKVRDAITAAVESNMGQRKLVQQEERAAKKLVVISMLALGALLFRVCKK